MEILGRGGQDDGDIEAPRDKFASFPSADDLSLAAASNRSVNQHPREIAPIPTINIQGTTPRSSFAPSMGGPAVHNNNDTWQYEQVPPGSATATHFDLHGVSPLEQTRIAAKRQGSGTSEASWATAADDFEGVGFAR